MAEKDDNEAIKVTVKSRHVDEPTAVKAYAAEKFGRMGKYSQALRTIDVMLQPGGGTLWECEAIMQQDRHPTIVLSIVAGDLHSAVDLALERAERMLTRVKERTSSRNQRSGRFVRDAKEE